MADLEYIKQLFIDIDNITGGDFVVLRNFDEIPDCSYDNDIDVLIPFEYINALELNLDTSYAKLVDNCTCLYTAKPHIHFRSYKRNFHLDVVNGLYYVSPDKSNTITAGSYRVPVNEILQDTILDNKVRVDGIHIYEPSKEDQIVHLCCHCIFDRVEVPQKYYKYIDCLFSLSNKQKLKDMLRLAFYKLSDLIFEAIEKKEVESIVRIYYGYKGY